MLMLEPSISDLNSNQGPLMVWVVELANRGVGGDELLLYFTTRA